MGSFQQIILGAACVGGAFWFGHYLNHHPNPDRVENELAENNALPPLESKTSLLEPGTKLSQLPNYQTRPLVDPLSTSESALPPPSQLDLHSTHSPDLHARSSHLNSRVPSTSQSLPPNNEPTEPGREITRPDFSDLAASFRNTPLELPTLPGSALPRSATAMQGMSAMPAQGNEGGPADDPFQRNGTSEIATVERYNERTGNPHVPPAANENLVRTPFDPFPAAANASSREVNDSNNPSSYQVNDSRDGFNESDFAPRLKGRFDALTADESSKSPMGSLPVRRAREIETSKLPNSVFSLNDNLDLSQPTIRQSAQNFNSIQTSPANVSVIEPPSLDSVDRHEHEGNSAKPNFRSSKPMLPFGLDNNEKNNLVRLRRPMDRQVKIEATRYTDYQTVAGDTLPSLSTQFFGRPDFYLDIYLVNQDQLRNPATVPAGIVLKIPVYENQ